jgi:hypothetical protein
LLVAPIAGLWDQSVTSRPRPLRITWLRTPRAIRPRRRHTDYRNDSVIKRRGDGVLNPTRRCCGGVAQRAAAPFTTASSRFPQDKG